MNITRSLYTGKITSYIILGLIMTSFFGVGIIHAQITSEDIDARRVVLEKELIQIEKDIDGQKVFLEDKQRERVSLERDVAILDAQINKAKLSIRARDITIGGLGSDIINKRDIIKEFTDRIKREKESLAQLIRRTNEIDDYSLIEVVLSKENLSDLFSDVTAFDALGEALNESLSLIVDAREYSKGEKIILEEKKSEEEDLKIIQVLQKRRIEERESEKTDILNITKGEEDKYQEIIKAKRKSAAVIRSELFSLRGSDAIPFEKALSLAQNTFNITGVRPAFLLGVIAEESNLGANLGSGNYIEDLYECYISIGYLTSAEKQKKAFLEITSALGLNPDTMPVSKAPYYGCGGAMGPAQFMPTTWILYDDLVAKKTGNNPPNPWDPEDAFMASALLLKDNGAAAGGYTAERRAALRYLAGGNWKKPAYAFYGDDVMELAEKYQGMINILQGG